MVNKSIFKCVDSFFNCCLFTVRPPPPTHTPLHPVAEQCWKEAAEEWVSQMKRWMVVRLGAWIWDRAWKQRILQNSPGWNSWWHCPPQPSHTPEKKRASPSLTLPLSPPAVLLTDGGKGGWVDGLRGLKLCGPILEPTECHFCKRWGAERHLWREWWDVWSERGRVNVKKAGTLPLSHPFLLPPPWLTKLLNVNEWGGGASQP